MKRILCRTIKEAEQLLSSLNTTVFSFDTETTSLRYDILEIVGISFCDGSTAGYIFIDDENRDNIITMLSDFFLSVKKGSVIEMHNSVFDTKVLYKYGIKVKGEWFDTMIANHLIDENRPSGLKHLTREILNKDVVEFNDVSQDFYSDKFGEYGIDDAVNTYELANIFKQQLKDLELTKLFRKIEMPFQRVLLQMEVTGVMVDQPKLKKFQDTLKNEVITLESALYDLLDERYSMQMDFKGNILSVAGNRNFNSTHQLADILFKKLKLQIIETTDSGLPKTGKVTIEKYRKDVPFVEALYKYKIATKLNNGFISEDGQIANNLQNDGRVRPNFNDIGTRTGRLSCTKPNLQQLPNAKDYSPVAVREIFKVPDGYKMFSCDYSGQEVAVMAQVSKDETLVKSLNAGYDMHLAIANQFYNLNIPEECLSKQHKDYNDYKSKFKKERTQAKVITFGLAYGKGAYGFSKDFGISEDEAQKIVDDYFDGMPGLKKAIDNTHNTLRENGYVRSMAGRLRHFSTNEQGYYPNGAYRQSFNFLIQGFSADMIRAAAVNVYAKKHPKEWCLSAIMTVHDEMNYQVKEEYAEEAAKYVKQCFENTCKFIVPTKADTEIGENYGNAK